MFRSGRRVGGRSGRASRIRGVEGDFDFDTARRADDVDALIGTVWVEQVKAEVAASKYEDHRSQWISSRSWIDMVPKTCFGLGGEQP